MQTIKSFAQHPYLAGLAFATIGISCALAYIMLAELGNRLLEVAIMIAMPLLTMLLELRINKARQPGLTAFQALSLPGSLLAALLTFTIFVFVTIFIPGIVSLQSPFLWPTLAGIVASAIIYIGFAYLLMTLLLWVANFIGRINKLAQDAMEYFRATTYP